MLVPETFTANSTPIHTLITAKDNKTFLSAAVADRFINIFSLVDNKHMGALVAEADVTRVSVFEGANDSVLAAVTAEGIVEVFKAPFEAIVVSSDAAVTRKKKALTKKGEAKVRIVRPNGKDAVIIADVSVSDEEIVLAWVESGVNVEFERVRWADAASGILVLTGSVDITRTKSASIAANGAVMNGVKEVGKMTVDQSHAIVVGGDDMQDVGMEDAPAAESEGEEEEQSAGEDEDDDMESAREPEEPSFADRFQALEVSAKPTNALAPLPTKRSLEPPTANALTSVLTQALKTNDTSLLESCLHTTDTNTILNTVRKLPSPMAVTLLENLAERLARKPGRAGSLGEWVRWTLVAHGGYLVTLPNLVRTLAGLYSTLNTRAGALPRLLALQGRLDMLSAQVQLRHNIRSANAGESEDVSDEGVLYVEGETPESDSDDESDEEPEEVGLDGMRIEDASYIKSTAALNMEEHDEDDEEGSSAGESESDDEDDEDQEEDDEAEEDVRAFLDIEASESEDNADADSVDYDDVDSESGEEEEEVAKKVKTKSRR